MISFRSGSCLSKLERVKENIFEVFQISHKIKRRHDILKSHAHVLFYALLFASSCRSKRNYPVAETECYSDNSYKMNENFRKGKYKKYI